MIPLKYFNTIENAQQNEVDCSNKLIDLDNRSNSQKTKHDVY